MSVADLIRTLIKVKPVSQYNDYIGGSVPEVHGRRFLDNSPSRSTVCSVGLIFGWTGSLCRYSSVYSFDNLIKASIISLKFDNHR